MAQVDVIPKGCVAISDDGRISAVGAYATLKEDHSDAKVIEIEGVLFPGFVDAHTHAVFGAARTADHERRARGVGYKEIAAAGGGILSSVRDVRECSVGRLTQLLRTRLSQLVANGATTVEVKSGYGLSVESELMQLEAIRRVAVEGGPTLVPTFLGAHEVPEEYRDAPAEYVDLVVNEMLPAVREQGVARYCDVFCEPGVFTPAQSRVVLEAARRQDFGLKIHADELDGSGGAELAVELGAISADHLAAASPAGIEALARGQTVAVLLPGTMLFLGRPTQAPARKLIDAGAAVALATDFNPGSSPGMSLPLMATIGVSQMHMLPSETVVAITVNAAAAIGEAGSRGQISPGFRADLTLAAASDWRELPYWFGATLIRDVWINGVACHPRRWPLNSLG